MNNITQVKRGSTASWSLGPELVHWENLDVWGKDSLIHCEGTDLKMNVYTASANYFYDENGQLEKVKRPGLWLIQPEEINWPSVSSQAVFRCKVGGPSDCWIEVYSELSKELHGQKIYLNSQPIEMTIPYHGKWGLYMRWPEEKTLLSVANVKLSIREVNAYEELAPGQLGVEYTDDGKVKLKAGMPNESKWNELPYIGGESAAIIDVVKLPTENINEDVFYRLLKGTFVFNQYVQNRMTCISVNNLPEEGYPVFSGDLTTPETATVTAYYDVSQGRVSGYVTPELTAAFGVPTGWHFAEDFLPNFGYEFSGTIIDIEDDPRDSTFRLLLEYTLYSYTDEKWTSYKNIGMPGTGAAAERFNHPTNIASGGASHAEGFQTEAIGDYSHAEGLETLAQGNYSHVEGWLSHAEGHGSHAEGVDTYATGNGSHAEGLGTTARGRHQHVQGRYNIEDTENTYAHIVGNGQENKPPSNAHTLDWNGNAWFAGDVYVGGTGQNDPNAKKLGVADIESATLITTDDIDAICGATMNMATLENEVTF